MTMLSFSNGPLAIVENDQATAGLSLKVTYTGLVFILIGFGLQICGYLPPERMADLWKDAAAIMR